MRAILLLMSLSTCSWSLFWEMVSVQPGLGFPVASRAEVFPHVEYPEVSQLIHKDHVPALGHYCFCWSQLLWYFSGKEDRNLESNSLQPCLEPALSTLLTWQMSSAINPLYQKKPHTMVPDKYIWSNNFCGHFVCHTQVSKFSFNE